MDRSAILVRTDLNLGANRLYLGTKRLDTKDREYETTRYHLLENRRIDDVIINNLKNKLILCCCSAVRLFGCSAVRLFGNTHEGHRQRQNVIGTLTTHSAAPRVPPFNSYHIFTSSVTYMCISEQPHSNTKSIC